MAATRTGSMQESRRSDKGSSELTQQGGEMLEYLRDYARENPEMAAVWCFGIGFVLGWRLKPW
jgi:hypothetical protein